MCINSAVILILIATLVIAALSIDEIKVIEALPAAKIMDWKVQPYVSLELVAQPDDCPEGSHDIFNRTWHGIEYGCNSRLDGVLTGIDCGSGSDRLVEIASEV